MSFPHIFDASLSGQIIDDVLGNLLTEKLTGDLVSLPMYAQEYSVVAVLLESLVDRERLLHVLAPVAFKAVGEGFRAVLVIHRIAVEVVRVKRERC